MYPAPELKRFSAERESALRAIKRFHTFDVMHYRTNLWLHSHRVAWIVQDMLPFVRRRYPKVDAKKMRLLALVHDDVEIITGDMPSWKKPRMRLAEKRNLYERELAAAKVLARRYPKFIGKYSYFSLLREVMECKTIEMQFVAWADKMDGHCEGLHEAFSGNTAYFSTIFYYGHRFARLVQEFPLLARIHEFSRLPFLDVRLRIVHTNARQHRHFGKPFTRISIGKPTAFPWYDRWRVLTLKHLGKREGLAALTKQREGF